MEVKRPRPDSAVLLAQIGAHAAQRFTERIAELDLTPVQFGLLRLVAARPGQSQQSLAKQLGTPATRLVPLVDGLEKRGLIERRRNAEDRRLYAVELSEDGHDLMTRVVQAGQAHEEAVTAALTDTERDVLHGLLSKIADRQGLSDSAAGSRGRPARVPFLRPPAGVPGLGESVAERCSALGGPASRTS